MELPPNVAKREEEDEEDDSPLKDEPY